MTRYRVYKYERWIQEVIIEADSEIEARLNVAKGHGDIYQDAEYDEDIEFLDWQVQKEE